MAYDKNGEKETDQTGGSDKNKLTLSRRSSLASLIGIGGLSLLGSSSVRGAGPPEGAGPPPKSWKRDVDANGHKLLNLGALTTSDNPSGIKNFAGDNLSIDDNGALNATSSTQPWSDDVDAQGNSLTNVGGISTAASASEITDFAGNNLTIDESGVLNVSGTNDDESSDIIPIEKYKLLDFQSIGVPVEDEFTSLGDENNEDALFPFEEYEIGGSKLSKFYISLVGENVSIPIGGDLHIRFDASNLSHLSGGEFGDFTLQEHIASGDPFSSPKVEFFPEDTDPQNFYLIHAEARLENVPSGHGLLADLSNV